jgi:hypothetical protein
MRTSLRVFLASLSTLLIAAFAVFIPSPPAGAVNGIHTINVSNATCDEGVTDCNVTVTLQGGVNFGPTITATIKSTDGSARAGSDYVAVNAPVSWAGGESGSKTVPVTINADTSKEPDENFTLSVTNPVQAAAGTSGTVTITNNDGNAFPKLVISGAGAANEGNADNNRVITVSVTDPSADQAMHVNYATRDGSATSDTAKGAVDYTPITTQQLTWAAGDGSAKQIPITIKGDTLAEPNENFFLDFGSGDNLDISNGNPASIGLTNDDGAAPVLTIDPIEDKKEGDTAQTTQTINVTLTPAPQQAVTVDYTTSDGTATASTQDAKGDYETAKGTLTFTQGISSKNFTVNINGDAVAEQDETYHVTLSNPHNAALGDPATRDAKILNDDFGQITTVPGTGGGPHVRVWGATGSDLAGFMAVQPDSKGNPFTGGLHVARGDFYKADGSIGTDGVDEIIVGAGRFPTNSSTRSRPFVRIFALDGRQLASFFAYDPEFSGGVFVAAGNLDGDTSNGDELVTGAGPGGGPHVRIWRVQAQGDTNAVVPIGGFFAYDQGFGGGVHVAVGNENGDGKDEIVTGAGPGGGPHVRVFTPTPDGGATGTSGFFAYDPNFHGGVNVAAGAGRIVTGPGAGGGPHVRVFDGNGGAMGGGFMAYDPSFTGGVSVGFGNLDNDLASEIVTGAGPGGGPHVRIFRQDGTEPFGHGFFAYDPSFGGGVEVAVSGNA